MPLTVAPTTTSRTSFGAVVAATAVLLTLAVGGMWSSRQVAMVPSAVPPSLAVSAEQTHHPLASDAHAQLRLSAAGPTWDDLSESQHLVLLPLRDRWSSMGALSKRRWLVLADRFPFMSESERIKLVSRMNTWASLSAKQRNQARLNFENVKRLSAQELQAKWDAYQALSEAERQSFAEKARKAQAARKAKQRKIAKVPPLDNAAKTSKATVTQPAENASSTSPVTVTPIQIPSPIVETQPVRVPQTMPMVNLPPLVISPSPDVQPSSSLTPLDSHQFDTIVQPTP